MMNCTVADVFGWIDDFAPFATADASDNVGLLIGRMDWPVQTILTALDATPEVVREAQRLGAQLLVTHHPLMFSPRRRLDEADPEAALLCDIVRAGLSLIAAHTNLDIASGGVNDALLEQLGWTADWADGYLRVGGFEPRELETLRQEVQDRLGAPVIRYGSRHASVSRFAVCSGSGGDEVENAARCGAQVLLTGEIKHAKALEAMARGLTVLTAGHRATEICAADLLCKHLQSSAHAVQLDVQVFVSAIDPFLSAG